MTCCRCRFRNEHISNIISYHLQQRQHGFNAFIHQCCWGSLWRSRSFGGRAAPYSGQPHWVFSSSLETIPFPGKRPGWNKEGKRKGEEDWKIIGFERAKGFWIGKLEIENQKKIAKLFFFLFGKIFNFLNFLNFLWLFLFFEKRRKAWLAQAM